MNRTREQALSELDGLINKIPALHRGHAFDAEHVRWRQAVVAFLEEIFGPESNHFVSFVHLRWQPQGSFIVHGFDVEEQMEAHKQKAYLDQLDTAKGLLLAARDELARRESLRGVSRQEHGPRGKYDCERNQSRRAEVEKGDPRRSRR